MVRRWYLFLLFAFSSFFSPHHAHAAVYTTRSGVGQIDNPSSFGAKQIYSGRFKINGVEAEMVILASNLPSNELFTNLVGNPASRPDVRHSKSAGGTILGSIGEGSNSRRFLITPVSSDRSSMMFVLKNPSEIPSRSKNAAIPWPKSLPEFDFQQDNQLVIEHIDTDFIFASVAVRGDANPERVLLNARQRMLDNGWEVEPLTDKVLSDLPDSRFAVVAKNSKICWLEARAGNLPNEVLITLLCKKP